MDAVLQKAALDAGGETGEDAAQKRQLLEEELFWRDYYDHEQDYAQYAQTYEGGSVPFAELHGSVAEANARIVELEQEIRRIEGRELSDETFAYLSAEAQKALEEKQASQLAALREELKAVKAQVESENREYSYYWSRVISDMQTGGKAASEGSAQTEQALRGSNAELWKYYHNISEFLKESENTDYVSGDINLTFLSDNRIEFMTADECRIFLYCCNIGNLEAAEAYLQDIQPTLTARKGAKQGEKYDIPVIREAIALFRSAAQGVENIGYGIGSLFTDMDAPELTAGDYMMQYWQEANKGSLAYYTTAAAANIGNQLPTVMAYAFNPMLGKATTFLNTRGSAYVEAKRNGASHAEAWTYSTLVGASEAGLEALLGAAGGRIKGVLPQRLTKWLGNIGATSSKLAPRLLKDFAVSNISEIIEENTQNYLEPAFAMLAGMTDRYDAPGMEDFLETTIVTVLSSSAFYASNLPQKTRQLKYNDAARAWAEQAVKMGEESELSELAGYGKEIMDMLDEGQDISPEYMNALFAQFGDLQQTQSTADKEDAPGTQKETGIPQLVNAPQSPVETSETSSASIPVVDIIAQAEQSVKGEETSDSANRLPDWQAYEAAHKGERYEYDPSEGGLDQTEVFEGWREDDYDYALKCSDEELAYLVNMYREQRDNVNATNKERAIAQYHLDAYEYVQAQRAQKNAALEQQNGGMQNAEILNDGGQRDEGVGARGQGGAVEGGTGRPVSRGETRTQADVIRDLKTNGRAQSAKEIGVQDGGEKQTVYVLSEEQVAQSESWSRIRDDAEADGAKVVFMVGAPEVFNKSTKKYGKVEGVHRVDAHGQTTYYIRVDKLGRNAEQIYRHEKFHELVSANPRLMVDLMDALDAQYTQQEIAAMVNSYVEAYDGIYGRFDESMTDDELDVLRQQYLNEIFADAYAGIKRGHARIDKARKVLSDQTDAVQRAEQNSKAMRNKTAPPKQRYAIKETADGRKYVQADRQVIFGNDPDSWSEQLEDYINGKIRRGENVKLIAEDGDILTLTNRTAGKVSDNHNSNGTTMNEADFWRKVNAGVHIDELAIVSTRGNKITPDYDSRHGEEASGGWNYRRAYFRDFDGKYYRVKLSVEIGSDGNAVYNIGEMVERSLPTITGSSAISGAQKSEKASSGERIPHNGVNVKQEFSFDDDVEELDEEYKRKVEEGEAPRRGKTEPEWETVRSSLDEYNAAAKAEKEVRAEKSTITALKNRIGKNEQILRELTDMKALAKKSNFLSRSMEREIDARKEIVKETLQIDRAALKRKQDAKTQEDKARKQKKQAQEVQQVKARQATEELVAEVMELFSTKKGERYDMREMLWELTDQIVKEGRITSESRDKLLEALYKNSEVVVPADVYLSDIRKFMQQGRIYVPESVRSDFGDDWNSFRQRAWGNRIYLTANENDAGVDMWAQELAGIFGGRFTESLDPREQLEMIIDLAEEGKEEHLTIAEMMQRNEDNYGWSVAEQMEDLEQKVDRMLEMQLEELQGAQTPDLKQIRALKDEMLKTKNRIELYGNKLRRTHCCENTSTKIRRKSTTLAEKPVSLRSNTLISVWLRLYSPLLHQYGYSCPSGILRNSKIKGMLMRPVTQSEIGCAV